MVRLSNKQIISGRKILVTETIIPHWLTKQASLSPEKTAIETINGNQLTFHDLEETRIRSAYKLAEKGVKPKQRVAILSTNCLDMVIAIHALSYLQAFAVMVNTKLTARQITCQLKVSKAMLLIESGTMPMVNQNEFKAIYTYEERCTEQELFVETGKGPN